MQQLLPPPPAPAAAAADGPPAGTLGTVPCCYCLLPLWPWTTSVYGVRGQASMHACAHARSFVRWTCLSALAALICIARAYVVVRGRCRGRCSASIDHCRSVAACGRYAMVVEARGCGDGRPDGRRSIVGSWPLWCLVVGRTAGRPPAPAWRARASTTNGRAGGPAGHMRRPRHAGHACMHTGRQHSGVVPFWSF